MSNHVLFRKELSLLPDSELLQLADEIRDQKVKREKWADRASKRQELVRTEEALTRELRARGIGSQPWWAQL